MTLPDPHAQLRTVRESLAMAARPAEEQLALLPGGAAGQLAHIHEDVAHLAPGLRAAGLLDGEAFRRLAAFDRHHEEMREDDALWTDEALRSDPRWEESRGLAAAALPRCRALGRGVRPLRLGGVARGARPSEWLRAKRVKWRPLTPP